MKETVSYIGDKLRLCAGTSEYFLCIENIQKQTIIRAEIFKTNTISRIMYNVTLIIIFL